MKMNPDPQSALASEETIVVLADNDICTEKVGGKDDVKISADQAEDASFQANGQNFQNNWSH